MSDERRARAGALAQRALGTSPALPAWARSLARLLDSAVTVPGTQIKVGLDPILGLVLPEVGDALTLALAVTLLGVAWKERVPRWVLGRMLVNIVIDGLVGAIPVVGDLFDFAFRANDKNLELIERHRGDPNRPVTWVDRLVVAGALLVAVVALLTPIVVGVALLRWLLLRFG